MGRHAINGQYGCYVVVKLQYMDALHNGDWWMQKGGKAIYCIILTVSTFAGNHRDGLPPILRF